MAAVILRVDWNSYPDDDIESVELVEDDQGDVKIFSDMIKADAWLEENHDTGYSYHITEL